MSDKKSLGSDEIVTERKISRRGAVGVIAGGAVAVAGAMALLGTTACCTGGTGRVSCSDSDPSDPAGAGRSCGGAAGGRRVCSDTDPNDPAGAGIHC